MNTEKNNILKVLLDEKVQLKLGEDGFSESLIKKLDITENKIFLRLEYGFPVKNRQDFIKNTINEYLTKSSSIKNISIVIDVNIASHSTGKGTQLISGVKNIIAVASGKGGVGKSTTAVNLALSLFLEGARVGILDGDIYGPSIPSMLGISGKPESPDGKTILPMKGHGLQANSIGFLVPKNEAMVWRGPMVTQALEQLLRQTAWDNLDYLFIDLPPGTGDIHLTLAQKVPLTGAIIVTTPQEIALLDARKGIKMFEKVAVPLLGVVENMASYICPNCEHVSHIFGSGGGEEISKVYKTRLLGSLPLNKTIREDSDSGVPTVLARDDLLGQKYKEISLKIARDLASMKVNDSLKFPKIVVEKT